MKKSKKIVLIVISCIVVLATIAGVIFAVIMNQVAPPVIKFEKERAKEIASFKEKMPGYIVDADNRASRVEFLLVVPRYAETGMEKFVNEHNLKKRFPKAKIETGYSTIRLQFKRNDYTKAVHDALTKLAKKYPVQSGSPYVYSASSIKYKPDISLHAKNPTKLEYTVKVAQNFGTSDMPTSNDSNITDVNRILTTKADYDAFIDMFAAEYDFELPPDANQHIKDKYGEEFFETNALLVTKEITRSDLGYGLSVDNVYLSDNKIYVVIRTSNSEGMAPTALLEKTFYITVSKDAIKGATELITLD